MGFVLVETEYSPFWTRGNMYFGNPQRLPTALQQKNHLQTRKVHRMKDIGLGGIAHIFPMGGLEWLEPGSLSHAASNALALDLQSYSTKPSIQSPSLKPVQPLAVSPSGTLNWGHHPVFWWVGCLRCKAACQHCLSWQWDCAIEWCAIVWSCCIHLVKTDAHIVRLCPSKFVWGNHFALVQASFGWWNIEIWIDMRW